MDSIPGLMLPVAALMFSQLSRYTSNAFHPVRLWIKGIIIGSFLLLAVFSILSLLQGTSWLHGERMYWSSGALGGLAMIAFSCLNRR